MHRNASKLAAGKGGCETRSGGALRSEHQTSRSPTDSRRGLAGKQRTAAAGPRGQRWRARRPGRRAQLLLL